jgi:adenosylhomocysteinase
LGARYIKENAHKMDNRVYVIPEDIDNEIARLKLETMGMEIDRLSDEQVNYLSSWRSGT